MNNAAAETASIVDLFGADCATYQVGRAVAAMLEASQADSESLRGIAMCADGRDPMWRAAMGELKRRAQVEG